MLFLFGVVLGVFVLFFYWREVGFFICFVGAFFVVAAGSFFWVFVLLACSVFLHKLSTFCHKLQCRRFHIVNQ